MPGPRIAENIDCHICLAVKAMEPEVDGDYALYECRECGSATGFRKVSAAGPTCAAGLAIDPAPEPAPGPVFLGTIKVRERHNDETP
jgi:hypothetical protein